MHLQRDAKPPPQKDRKLPWRATQTTAERSNTTAQRWQRSQKHTKSPQNDKIVIKGLKSTTQRFTTTAKSHKITTMNRTMATKTHKTNRKQHKQYKCMVCSCFVRGGEGLLGGWGGFLHVYVQGPTVRKYFEVFIKSTQASSQLSPNI